MFFTTKEMTSRHEGIITEEEQDLLSNSTVCVAGTGGVGGWAALALTRAGFLNFKLADPEDYDISNLNRQATSSSKTIGSNKAKTLAEKIKEINPNVQISIYEEGINNENLISFMEEGDIVIDGIDLYEMKTKRNVFEWARSSNIPVISCPVLGFGASIALFHPKKSPSFDRFFGDIPARSDNNSYNRFIKRFASKMFVFRPKLDWKLIKQCVESGRAPSLGVSCMLSGSLTATVVIDYVLKKNKFPYAPKTVHVDLLEQKMSRKWFGLF